MALLIVGVFLLILSLPSLLYFVVNGGGVEGLVPLATTALAIILIVQDRRYHASETSWWRRFQPSRGFFAILGVIMIPICIIGGWLAEWDTGSPSVGWITALVASVTLVLASPFLPKRPEF